MQQNIYYYFPERKGGKLGSYVESKLNEDNFMFCFWSTGLEDADRLKVRKQ